MVRSIRTIATLNIAKAPTARIEMVMIAISTEVSEWLVVRTSPKKVEAVPS